MVWSFIESFVCRECVSDSVKETMDYDSLIYSHIANYYDELVSPQNLSYHYIMKYSKNTLDPLDLRKTKS